MFSSYNDNILNLVYLLLVEKLISYINDVKDEQKFSWRQKFLNFNY